MWLWNASLHGRIYTIRWSEHSLTAFKPFYYKVAVGYCDLSNSHCLIEILSGSDEGVSVWVCVWEWVRVCDE